jgi:hypothetical protein
MFAIITFNAATETKVLPVPEISESSVKKGEKAASSGEKYQFLEALG